MMINLYFILQVILLVGSAQADESTVPALTLTEVYSKAIQLSEAVGVQRELKAQSEEHIHQTYGAILPTINGIGSYTQQAGPKSTLGGVSASTFYPTSQPLAKLTLAQPIFHGLSEYAALRQKQRLDEAQQETVKQATSQLYSEVATAFYSILSLEKDFANLKVQIDLYGQRILELQQRVKTGRSQLSDVLTTQAAAANLRAQSEQILGQIESARENFEYITGLSRQTSLVDSTPFPSDLGPLKDFLEKRERRPDVRASRIQLAAASENVSVARGAHIPSLDLNANYYFWRYGALQNEGINWDFTVLLTVPIFAGGTVESKVREATSQERQSTLLVNQVTRQADTQIRSAYLTLEADRSQMLALKTATDLAERNFLEETREFRLGLVPNIDVLTALANFQETNRAFDRQKFTVLADWAKLQAAVADYPQMSKVGSL